MKNVSYQPTEGLSYDPGEEKYWDAAALQMEITRVFEVCHDRTNGFGDNPPALEKK